MGRDCFITTDCLLNELGVEFHCTDFISHFQRDDVNL